MSDESTFRCYESSDSMSGSVTNESESGEVQDVSRRYVVGRIPDYNTVVRWVTERYAPRYVTTDGSGKYWVRRRLNVRGIGNQYWDCTADYQTLVPKDPGSEEQGDSNVVPGSIAWDTTGRTERIYQALDENVFPPGSPTFDGAINVSGTSVEGIDIPKPGMRYSETWIFPADLAMSDDYANAVFRLTGSLNADSFRFFSRGECLFMGGRCQWQSDQPYATIAFEWEGRPNEPEYYASPGFGGTFFKYGWDYVWCRYSDEVHTDTLVRRPKSAHKNRVFEFYEWSDLLITELPPPGRGVSPVVPVPGFGGPAFPQ